MYEATATWAEINFYVAFLAISLISVAFGLWWDKRHGDKYVTWIEEEKDKYPGKY